MVRKRSCPAVSQICSFTRTPSRSTVRILKSMPIVVMNDVWKSSSEKRNNRHDLPTPACTCTHFVLSERLILCRMILIPSLHVRERSSLKATNSLEMPFGNLVCLIIHQMLLLGTVRMCNVHVPLSPMRRSFTSSSYDC